VEIPADRAFPRAVLQAASPHLFVSDVKAACDFFQKLGFLTVFTYGEPPFYGHVRRDGALLVLRCVDGPVFEDDIRERELLLSAEITVRSADEIKRLFAEFQSAGVVFKQTLERQPWGAANFIIKDPDGNLLLFAGPAD
jgi:uncharacterized glyoxalase superfamily protein PhnB